MSSAIIIVALRGAVTKAKNRIFAFLTRQRMKRFKNKEMRKFFQLNGIFFFKKHGYEQAVSIPDDFLGLYSIQKGVFEAPI
jgi:hypothetical protein